MRVGIIGTGYAARARAEALRDDGRTKLIAVAGHSPSRAGQFGGDFGVSVMQDWPMLLHATPLDLIFICNVNRDHGTIAKAALEAGKHVVVEYPLALSLSEAEALIALAAKQKKLLHIEHIELLSGIHQVLVRELPALGKVFTVDYTTLTACLPSPDRWTFRPNLFGFPLVGAVSRIHRLIDLFGNVTHVSCSLRYDGSEMPDRFRSCICSAQLTFADGLVATLSYGKGESIWRSRRVIEIHGHGGALIVDGDQAVLIRPDGAHSLEVGSRRGLFYQDTHMVLDHLMEGTPLYVTPEASLIAHKVAYAAEQAALTHQIIAL